MVPAADPTGGVTTVVTPDASVGGMTTAVLDAAPELAVPVGVTTFCDWLDWPEAEGVAGEPAPPRVPSGSTQFTSRCVQKSGMLLRFVESAPYEAGAVSAASAAPIAIIIVRLVFMTPPNVPRMPGRPDIASIGQGLSGFACSTTLQGTGQARARALFRRRARVLPAMTNGCRNEDNRVNTPASAVLAALARLRGSWVCHTYRSSVRYSPSPRPLSRREKGASSCNHADALFA